MRNREVVLVARPLGIAQAEHFAIRDAPVVAPGPGEITVRNRYLSVEPAMRGWIADTGGYSDPVAIGEAMRSLAAGEVVESRHPLFAPGDHVMGWFGWRDRATVPAGRVVRRTPREELRASLGVLGLTGVTALLALTRVGEPRPGETVVVSTAAGAVGSTVGQIARIMGCRAVGIAGGPDKARACVERYGYDAAIDYRGEDVGARVGALCPDGVHVYFDNTAGAISDAVLPHLAVGARVVVCGTASVSRWNEWPVGPRVERHLLVKRARMQGFVVFDHLHGFEEAVATLRGWLADGGLVADEDVLNGLEACPDALAGLYRGENRGKRLIRLVEDEG